MTERTETAKGAKLRGRDLLLRRLIDIVALPGSRISPQNRSLAGDILVDMLFQVSDEDRALCATRLKQCTEAPRRLMRYLAQCRVEVAGILLENNKCYDASDLIDLVRTTTIEHQLIIAARKDVSCALCDVLIESGELPVVRILLANAGAEFSEIGVDNLVHMSKQHEELCSLIVKRDELTPAQAMAMFWWSDGPTRKTILKRHAGDRSLLIEQCSDVFAKFSSDDWNDPVARKTIQMIERRQRNRTAIERSRFESLEDGIQAAVQTGMTPEAMQELGYMCGMKPISMAKVMSDLGGEGMAVLCKATGLKRNGLLALWKAMRRPVDIDGGQMHPQLAYVMEVYDTLSAVKAQTVLRYWNWSLTASGQEFDADNDSDVKDSFSSTRRTAKLVFGT